MNAPFPEPKVPAGGTDCQHCQEAFELEDLAVVRVGEHGCASVYACEPHLERILRGLAIVDLAERSPLSVSMNPLSKLATTGELLIIRPDRRQP